MILWKRNIDSTRKLTKFAWYPRFEFDTRSPGKEKGDLFWLEKYILEQHYHSDRMPFRKWKKFMLERSKIAVYNELTKGR